MVFTPEKKLKQAVNILESKKFIIPSEESSIEVDVPNEEGEDVITTREKE
jgi:hypothetical protein